MRLPPIVPFAAAALLFSFLFCISSLPSAVSAGPLQHHHRRFRPSASVTMAANEDLDWLIGLTLEEARQRLQAAAGDVQAIRATEVDGQPQMVTMDYRMDRINVAVRDGKITAVKNRG